MTDEFSSGASPPPDAPEGILAWIELPTGNVFLTSEYDWVDGNDPGRASILNKMLKHLAPGPQHGSRLIYYCQFVDAFYDHNYQVYWKILEYDFGDEPVIY